MSSFSIHLFKRKGGFCGKQEFVLCCEAYGVTGIIGSLGKL